MADESFESNQTTEDILKKLEKYGDSLLDEEGHREWKRKKGIKVTTNVHERTGTNKRNKKKKKKIKELSTEPQSKQTTAKINDQDELLGKISNKNKKRCGENRHLHAMKEELKLNKAPETHQEHLSNNGEPAAQAPLSNPGDQPTSPAAVVVFNDPAKRKQRKNQLKRGTEDGPDDNSEDSHPTFELKKARLDVKWLGISGMNKESHLEARRKDLISRGAKPPKRAYMNYRELQEKRKVELSQVTEKREVDRRSGLNVGKSKDRNRRDRGEEYLDGQVGRFKDGVLYLDKDAKQQLKLRKSGPRGRNKNR